MTSPGAPARVLVALLVYGGREFTPAAVKSAAKMAAASTSLVDVLILDDASPHPGWSEELRALCSECGVQYYRTPRNLGIPRNMNLGLLRAEAGRYDACVLLNSDVIVPLNMVDQLAEVAATDRRIASVTAWSNDVSVYSLPNSSPTELATQERVDAVSNSLADEFGASCVPLPVGVGFCLYLPRHAIAEVGIMDPVFGRGYAEEVDWCCRAVEAGMAHVLAPGVFVFHAGSATNKTEGLLRKGERSVQVNESIVDLRHGWYRDELTRWERAAPLDEPRARALRRLVTEAARSRGVVVEATWLHRPRRADDSRVRVLVSPSGSGGQVGSGLIRSGPLARAGEAAVIAEVDGWSIDVPIGPDGVLGSVASLLGRRADEVRILERGPRSAELVVEAELSGVRLRDLARYPERVAPVA
jgi:GT2 family glycosyltransferase